MGKNISIIVGADGPTSVFVAMKFSTYLIVIGIIFIIILLSMVIAAFF